MIDFAVWTKTLGITDTQAELLLSTLSSLTTQKDVTTAHKEALSKVKAFVEVELMHSKDQFVQKMLVSIANQIEAWMLNGIESGFLSPQEINHSFVQLDENTWYNQANSIYVTVRSDGVVIHDHDHKSILVNLPEKLETLLAKLS